MNWDRLQGNCKLLRGKVHTAWGRLTENYTAIAAGQREQILGRAQVGYAISRDQELAEIQQFLKNSRRPD